MSSRRTGKRAAAAGRAGSGGTRRRTEPVKRGERRLLLQLVFCGSVFVLLVAVKLLLPAARMDQLQTRLNGALERNMDVQAVFSAVGRAFSGESEVRTAAGEVYRAVFGGEPDAVAVSAAPAPERSEQAMELLRQYRPPETLLEEADPAEEPSPSYILYSEENLPENVSMEQALLGFDHCTPVAGTLSSGFGYREHPVEGEDRFHYGVDLAAEAGTDIVCFADGTVTAVGESSSYGNYCTVAHENGFSTLYAHCGRVTAASGKTVRQGEKLGEVGSSGMATGPHLHFELQRNGTYLNPIYYVSGL